MESELLQSDCELVEKVKTGHRSSYSELVKRHQKGLLRLSMRFVKDLDIAQDIVQDSFIKAYEKLHSFEGRSSFKSWLFQIAMNTARNKLREYRHATSDISQMHLAVGATAESSLIHSAISQLIQTEVDRLPLKQKMALVLRVYEDLSFKEIAEIMECPYDTAKANYRHALLKLKEIFQENKELKNWTEDIGGFFMEMTQNQMEVE